MELKPYKIIFEPFNRAVIQFCMSRSKPRHWYTYNKSGAKDIRIISLEKTVHELELSAYRFTLGPFSLTVGW